GRLHLRRAEDIRLVQTDSVRNSLQCVEVEAVHGSCVLAEYPPGLGGGDVLGAEGGFDGVPGALAPRTPRGREVDSDHHLVDADAIAGAYLGAREDRRAQIALAFPVFAGFHRYDIADVP